MLGSVDVDSIRSCAERTVDRAPAKDGPAGSAPADEDLPVAGGSRAVGVALVGVSVSSSLDGVDRAVDGGELEHADVPLGDEGPNSGSCDPSAIIGHAPLDG
jgi:hypothetical protein